MQRAASLIRKLKLPPGSDNPENRAKAAWKLAAGVKIEKYTVAVSLVRGTLIVEVSDMMWQRNLYGFRHFLLRNLAEILGEPLVTSLDFRPMLLPRRGPQIAETPRADGIADPVMALLYQQSKKKQA
jgi:hypothetical protein